MVQYIYNIHHIYQGTVDIHSSVSHTVTHAYTTYLFKEVNDPKGPCPYIRHWRPELRYHELGQKYWEAA